jgi:YVTN family beta-propeller protein
VDVSNHKVIGTIALPRDAEGLLLKPKGIVLSADGKRIYVATGRGNNVAVLDAENQKVLQLIKVGQRPWGIALSPDGKRLYTANGLSNDVSVIDIDANKVVATIKAGDGPWGIVIKP